ncbi:MAG: hypothetical protein RLZZ416_276 [Candidatus Parcubacteria bacterium]|jgi:ComF family protein
MWNILETIIDVILPLRERSARTKKRSLEDIPLQPVTHELLGARITTLMDYRDPAVQDLIRSLKYDRSAHAARLAAELLADYLKEEIASSRAFSAREFLIMPVPLHKARVRERGYNQIEFVLRALSIEFRDGTIARLVCDALARTRNTQPQTRLPRSQRLSNVAGAFDVPLPYRVEKKRIFLIDDVTTTGATLVNAGNALRRANAEVDLIALARA